MYMSLSSLKQIDQAKLKALIHETKEVATSADMSFGIPHYKCFELINKFGGFEQAIFIKASFRGGVQYDIRLTDDYPLCPQF